MRQRERWLFVLGLCACKGGGDPTLHWSVHFANPDTAADAARVNVSIVAGDCSSTDVVYRSTVTREVEAEVPPNLANGRYSLGGWAVTNDCTLIAVGCTELLVPPRVEDVDLELRDIPRRPACTGACDETCREDDGSTGDGGKTSSCDGLSRLDGHCYRLENQLNTFADAEAACVEWGGHLVSLNDPAEELWVAGLTSVLGLGVGPTDFWIGFSDRLTETEWVWTDRSTAPSTVIPVIDRMGKVKYKTASDTPYTHWGAKRPTDGNDQPDNLVSQDSPNGQNCAVSVGENVSGPGGIVPRPSWEDRACGERLISICERP